MTEKTERNWSPSQDQIDNIIIPAMQRTAREYADHANALQCPPEFIAVMLRDIADAFEENGPKVENSCDCC
tara:strand:+ start:172 stop:384 length:213 start_codon:yes stop_codon:yes gene_type:complete